jgi:hypothetical protein
VKSTYSTVSGIDVDTVLKNMTSVKSPESGKINLELQIYIYDTSLYLLSQHYVYFTILHSLSSQHVSAPRAIIR